MATNEELKLKIEQLELEIESLKNNKVQHVCVFPSTTEEEVKRWPGDISYDYRQRRCMHCGKASHIYNIHNGWRG